MMMIIYDNDSQQAEELKQKINFLYPYEKVLCYNNLSDLMKGIKDYPHSILFLDVMLEQTTSIALSNEIKRISPATAIIFYSGYSPEFFDVYEGSHIYFLEKPISNEKLSKAINIGKAYLNKTFFTYHFAKATYKIPTASIVYFQSSIRIIKIVTTEKTLVFYGKLDDIQQSLPASFRRINKSHIVNSSYITQIVKNDVSLAPVKNSDALKLLKITKGYEKQLL